MAPLKSIDTLNVKLDFGEITRPVCRLGYSGDARHLVLEWDTSFADDPLPISPLALMPPAPPRPRSLRGRLDERGLWGVFRDSLPDDFGRRVLDTELAKLAIQNVGVLDLLAVVGTRGIGALTYHPVRSPGAAAAPAELGLLAATATEAFKGSTPQVVEQLRQAMGTAGGARPKVVVGITEAGQIIPDTGVLPAGAARWLIKFFGNDSVHSGVIEHVLSVLAGRMGVRTAESRLLTAETGDRYFATRRFDRNDGMRVHQHTFGELWALEATGPIEYTELLGVARRIGRSQAMADEGFHRLLVNLAIGNTDDHAKNFSFTMDPQGDWSWAPAYDLTQPLLRHNHQLLIAGRDREIEWQHCMAVADAANVTRATAKRLLEQVTAGGVLFPGIAGENGLPDTEAERVGARIRANLRRLSPV